MKIIIKLCLKEKHYIATHTSYIYIFVVNKCKAITQSQN